METSSLHVEKKGKLYCHALEKLWFVVADMIIDMNNREITPPRQATVALEGAKVLINLCKYHPDLSEAIGPQTLDSVQGLCVTCCGADIVARIECELHNIEDIMLVKAVNTLGTEWVLQWQKKISECWEELGKINK